MYIYYYCWWLDSQIKYLQPEIIVYLFHDKKPQDYIRKIEKGITTQLPNEKGQKDKQRSTKQKIEQHESD